jgi:hypothetical protein
MKKITILSIALVSLSLVSCKKDWTCTCKDSTGGEVRKFTKVTKNQASANCQTHTRTDVGGSETETCTLTK